MNWFQYFFERMLDEKTLLYKMGFWGDSLLFLAISLCLVSLFSRKMGVKNYMLALFGGIFLLVLDKNIELPLYYFFDNPRLKLLGMDTVLYVFAMFTGVLGTILILAFRKLRSIESICFTTSLLVMSVLIYSYHMLLLNGGLNIAVDNNESFYTKIISGDDHVFNFFCKDEDLTCYSGRISSLPKHFDELPDDFVRAYKDMAMKKAEPVFTLSRIATTSKVKFTSVFAQKGAQYRLIYDRKKAIRLFHSQRMQFMALTNSAVFFWFFVSGFVVFIHRTNFFKKRG